MRGFQNLTTVETDDTTRTIRSEVESWWAARCLLENRIPPRRMQSPIPLKLPGPQKARSVTIMKLEVAETIGIIAISNSGVTISRPPRRTGHSGQGFWRFWRLEAERWKLGYGREMRSAEMGMAGDGGRRVEL